MTRSRAFLLLILACALFYLVPLPFHGLWIPDETRYAQISQEMLLSGNWAAPHFMTLRYFEKPAAGYWMIAIGQALFGQNLFGVRVASAVSLGVSVLLTYVIARRLWNDPRRALAAAAVYMSFGLIAGQAGYANLDPQFTLWVNLSLMSLWYAIDAQTPRCRLWAWALLGAACGMGFMTKGFLAFALPALIGVPYMIWRKRFKEMVRFGLLAVLVAVLVVLPWVITVHLRESDFWSFFFWHEHIRRFAGEDAQHARPVWFYIPLLVLSSLPWAVLLPATFEKAWQQRRDPKIVFLTLWLLLPLGFLSLSKGKLPTYIMPCMMPLALLLGHTMVTAIEQRRRLALRCNSLINLVLGILALGAVIFMQIKRPLYVNETEHLVLVTFAFLVFAACNLLAFVRPFSQWLAPAAGMGVLIAILPAALPNVLVYKKTPDAFIAAHADELRQMHSLMSNELGAASGLSWHTGQPDVALYNVAGEAKYGLSYPDAAQQAVSLDQVGDWMTRARQAGSVGVVMRVSDDGERDELSRLPAGGKRYEQGGLIIVLYDQTAP